MFLFFMGTPFGHLRSSLFLKTSVTGGSKLCNTDFPISGEAYVKVTEISISWVIPGSSSHAQRRLTCISIALCRASRPSC
jgi:hypothetical protein